MFVDTLKGPLFDIVYPPVANRAMSRVVPHLNRKPVEIGTHYTGKHAGFADTRSGVYWEVHAPIEGDMRLLELALTADLLEQARERIARNVKALRQGKP